MTTTRWVIAIIVIALLLGLIIFGRGPVRHKSLAVRDVAICRTCA